MTPDPLAPVRAAYDAVARLRAALDDLRSVDAARAAYEEARSDLAARVAELERLPRPVPPPPAVGPKPPPVDGPAPRGPKDLPPPSPPRPPAPPPEDRPRQPSDAEHRLRLKKDANRWQEAWSLDRDALGQINRIADDPARPLGEAVALLPWAAFTAPTARLAVWGPALADYADHLAREVEFAELRAGGWLGVWRLWKRRETDPGRAAWEACLAGGRRELERRVAELERAGATT